MIDKKTFVCDHKACDHIKFKQNRYVCNSSSTLAKHRKQRWLHSCCTGADLCEAGEKVKTWAAEPKRKKQCLQSITAEDTTKYYECAHRDCTRVLSTLFSANRHATNKHDCGNTCTICFPNLPSNHIPPETPVPQEHSPTPRETFHNMLTDIGNGGNEYEYYPDIPLFSKDSIIIRKTGFGKYQWMGCYDQIQKCKKRTADLCQKLQLLEYNDSQGFQKLMNFVLKNDALMDKLLDSNLNTKTVVDILEKNAEFSKEFFRINYHPALLNMMPIPTIDACLAVKDKCCIGDSNWSKLVEMLDFPKELGINSIRRLRRETPSPSAFGGGYKYDIREMIRYAIKLEKNPNMADILFKISLDAGSVMKQSKINVEALTMEIISYKVPMEDTPAEEHNKSTSQCKSFKNAYLISLFRSDLEDESDPETNRNLKRAIVDTRRYIDDVITQPKLEIDEQHYYNIRLVLCVDMKCLCEVLGLVSVWNHKSKYSCCWCDIPRSDISNILPEGKTYPFRNISHMKDIWDKKLKGKAASTRSSQNTKYAGQQNEPLFLIPLSSIIPCILHLTMSIVKSLKNTLINIILNSDLALKQLQEQMKILKIKVNSNSKYTLEQQLRKTKFTRPTSIKFIKNYKEILKCLDKLPSNLQPLKEKIHLVFQQALYLLSVASSPRPNISEQDWLTCSKIFMSNYKEISIGAITSYIHVFVYHCGYFLEQYGGIEKLGNYSIEGTIHYIKKTVTNSTSGFGGRNEDKNHCLSQVLEKNRRQQPLFKKELPQKESTMQWSCRLQTELPKDFVKYFKDSSYSTCS